MKNKTSPTIYDVAKMSGVSRSCVSLYLNNQPYVSTETKKKIEKAIKALNYEPSHIARSLTRRKTSSIGLIVFDITNPYQTEIIRGIEEFKINNHPDYNIILLDMLSNETSGDAYIDTLLRNRVEGILTTTDRISAKCIKYLQKRKTPIIFIGIGTYINNPDIKVDYVTIDNLKGAYLITKYLLEKGHRKIFHIAGPKGEVFTTLRMGGYKKALKDSGIKDIKEKIIYTNDYTIESGFKAAKNIFSSMEKPTAIFCFSDYSAFGVIDYCNKNGINIPADVSVVGFDNVYLSSLYTFNLTTVSNPQKDYGRIAAETLFNRINFTGKKNMSIVLKSEVIVRKSVAEVKENYPLNQ